MSVLQALTVDIINAAKGTKDAKTRLFNLEQVREILLFRDTNLIELFISDVFDFTVDKSIVIRRFLIKFANELFQSNPSLALSHLVEMYRFFLDDSNDSIIQVMTQEIAKNYSKIVLLLCSSGLNNPTSSAQFSQLWSSMKAIVTKLNEMITSKRSEALREQCLRLLEEEILFGFPNTTATVDPRLARRANDPRLNRGGATAASSAGPAIGGTADEIPAHHPFMSKTDIQKEAEEYYSKIILWANKGSSQGITFSAHLLAVMAQVIGSIGAMRPACSTNAAQLMTFLISNKSSIIHQMSKIDRENLLRATHRLVRATSVYAADPEGQMLKLKGLISQLEAMVAAAASTAEEADTSGVAVGGKRDASAAQLDESQEDTEEKPEIKKARITAAIEAAEKNKELQLSKSLESGETMTGSVSAMAVESVFLQSVSEAEFTELSSDLVSFHNLSINYGQKLVNIQQQQSGIGSIVDAEFCCVPNVVNDGQGYADLSTFLLVKMMENYPQISRKDDKVRPRIVENVRD